MRNKLLLTLGFITVTGLLAGSALADLTWRVDFGPTPGSTEAGWSSWTPSSTSRTQIFANVDGGAENANMTTVITGSGTLNTYSRNMPAASSTNLYRDAAQYNAPAGTVNLTLSGLQANQDYSFSVWNYDYAFGGGTTQYYYDVTGGANDFLGQLVNTGNSNPGNVPTELYDTRYSLTTTLTADSSGTLSVNFNSGAGNTKINGFELIEVVPEPASVSLLGLGVVLAACRRRRSNR